MNEKFDLSQNSFMIFVFSYAPGLILGILLIASLHSFLPTILTSLIAVALFIGMIVKAAFDMQMNKRTLVITDDSIEIYLKKRKNNILLTKINNDEIESIRQIKDEAFLITKKNGEEVYIHLSCVIKPYKMLLYSVKKALYQVYGDRSDFGQDNALSDFIDNKTLPYELLKSDKQDKMIRVFLIILYLFFAGIPTLICVLSIIILILKLTIGFLQGLLALISVLK